MHESLDDGNKETIYSSFPYNFTSHWNKNLPSGQTQIDNYGEVFCYDTNQRAKNYIQRTKNDIIHVYFIFRTKVEYMASSNGGVMHLMSWKQFKFFIFCKILQKK